VLDAVIRNAKTVFCADAFTTSRTFALLLGTRPADGCVIVNNTYQHYDRRAFRVLNCDALQEAIIASIRAGYRPFCVFGSKTKAMQVHQAILKAIPDARLQTYTGAHERGMGDFEALRNVHGAWARAAVDAVLCTSCVTVGINYNPPADEDLFDELFVSFSRTGASVRDLMQATLRPRKLKLNRMTFALEGRGAANVAARAAADQEQRAAQHQLLAEATAGAGAPVRPLPGWFEEVRRATHMEKTVQECAFEPLVYRYLEITGYTVAPFDKATAKADSPDSMEPLPDPPALAEVPELSAEQAQKLERKRRRGEELTRIEIFAMERYFLRRAVSVESVEELAPLYDDWVGARAPSVRSQSRNLYLEHQGADAHVRAMHDDRDRAGGHVELMGHRGLRLQAVRELFEALRTTDSPPPNSGTPITFTGPELDAWMEDLAPLLERTRQAFDLTVEAKKENSKRTASGSAAELIGRILHSWSGATLTKKRDRPVPVKGQTRVSVYTYTVVPNTRWWSATGAAWRERQERRATADAEAAERNAAFLNTVTTQFAPA